MPRRTTRDSADDVPPPALPDGRTPVSLAVAAVWLEKSMLLRDVLRDLPELAGGPLDVADVTRDVESVLGKLRAGRPYAVCDACLGEDGADCPLCGGRGWLSRAECQGTPPP